MVLRWVDLQLVGHLPLADQSEITELPPGRNSAKCEIQVSCCFKSRSGWYLNVYLYIHKLYIYIYIHIHIHGFPILDDPIPINSLRSFGSCCIKSFIKQFYAGKTYSNPPMFHEKKHGFRFRFSFKPTH